MRIAQVITRGDVLGGAQNHVRELTRELRNLGHDVTVITGLPGVFTEQLRRDGIPWVHIPSMRRDVRPLSDAHALFRLYGILREIKPDIVCTHTAKAGWLGRAVSFSLGIPSTFTPHGWSMVERGTLDPKQLFCWAERFGAVLGTRVINVCNHERDLALLFRVCAESKMDIVRNGIPDIPFERLQSVRSAPPEIVMVARFEEQKDHNTVLAALSSLDHLEWRLTLVGEGGREIEVRRQIADLGLAKRVRILPAITDVPQLLFHAQIFVLSSNFEAFPISILEAMRAGVPVIASDVGGVSECIHDGETGLLVPRRDIASMRISMDRLISSPDLRARLGEAGRDRFLAHFTSDVMLVKTMDVYERAVERPHRRSPYASAAISMKE